MRLLDQFLAQKRAEKLRLARTMDEPRLARLVETLVAMGEVAIGPVSECLSHGDARGPALDVLGRLLGEATFERFMDLLRSPNPTIVSGAARVLATGTTFNPRRLLPALKEPVPSRAVLEPVLRAHAAAIPAIELVALLPALPRDGQATLLRTLDHGGDPNAVPALVQALRHEDPWLRGSIARFLSEHPGPGATAGLIGLLADSGKAVRLEAVHALLALGAREAVPALLGALEDPDLKVQSAAIDALRVLADVTAVPGLIAALTNESEYVRRGAVEVLNQVATTDAIQDLVRALRDADWWVRVRAADALGTLGGDLVVTAVAGLMQDADDSIRRHAVEILNSVPNPAAVPTLVAALDDADWWVRERAIDALGRTRDERAVDPLLDLLAREDRAIVLCVRALGAIGHPRALRPLAALLDSPTPEVRREAQEALADFPRGELSSADRSLLHDVLAKSQVGASHSTETPLRIRGVDAGGGLLSSHPRIGRAGDASRRIALPPDPAPSPSPAIRREPRAPFGINFAELAEGQELLERYRVLRKIGRGGFGTVYLVLDQMIQEEVILKILNPQLSMDESAARRFVQELKLTRRVAHPNVIRIHDFLDLGGARAISMQYFPGRDLGRLLGESGPLELRRGLKLAAQVCDGLAAAHAEDVIHRDIKPPNILIGDDDAVRLVDFGLAAVQHASAEGSRLTQSGLLIGTPEYMAPEQISGEAVDHRVDLYSLGVVMYEALSGRKPYVAETPVKVLFQHLEGGAAPLAEVVPGFPDAVSALVASAMARDPNQRPSTALELRAAIDRALESLEVPR